MPNDSGFKRTPSSRPASIGGHRSLLEWNVEDVDAEAVLQKLDNPALGIERRSGARKPPSFNPYDNGHGTRRR